MKAQLQSLQLEDPEAVFIVRRINKLGFASPDILRKYFSSYGQVRSIHVTHSRVKDPHAAELGADPWRLRPTALGFVVMASREATSRILADGPQHCVKGVAVRIQRFTHHPPDSTEFNQEADLASRDDAKQRAAGDAHGSVAADDVHEHPSECMRIKQETDLASNVIAPIERTAGDADGTGAAAQPRPPSPDSGLQQPGGDGRRSVSNESGGPPSSTSASGARQLGQPGVELQNGPPSPPKEQGGVDYRKAVEAEMEMLYSNFVISGGPVVYREK